MQDEYIKAIEKIQMDKDRKIEMRKILENEMASSAPKKPAKRTRLGAGAKIGIAAAAVAHIPDPGMQNHWVQHFHC